MRRWVIVTLTVKAFRGQFEKVGQVIVTLTLEAFTWQFERWVIVTLTL